MPISPQEIQEIEFSPNLHQPTPEEVEEMNEIVQIIVLAHL